VPITENSTGMGIGIKMSYMTNGFHVCEWKGSFSTENEHFKVLPMKTHDTMGMGMV
jgi:hypothetical protein